MNDFMTGLIGGIICTFVLVALGIDGVYDKFIKESIGYTLGEIQEQVNKCEAHIPRNKNCKVVISVKEET